MAIGNEKHRLFFEFMAYLGLRIGECCMVNIADLDFQTREIRIRSEKTHKLDLLVIPLPLWDRAQAYIWANRLAIDTSGGYLFYGEQGKSSREERFIEPNYMRKVFREAVVRAGIDEVYDVSEESQEGRGVRRLHILTTHSLRHFAITRFSRATNGNLILTSRFARHGRPQRNDYIHTHGQGGALQGDREGVFHLGELMRRRKISRKKLYIRKLDREMRWMNRRWKQIKRHPKRYKVEEFKKAHKELIRFLNTH